MVKATTSRLTSTLLAIVLPAAAGFGAIYFMTSRRDNAGLDVRATPPNQTTAQTLPPPTGPGTNSLSQGDMVKFVFRKEPEPLAEISFIDEAGATRSLKDFSGRTVLLNVWATWCLPCRKEMPALDRLQSELGSEKFEVVALSVDRAGAEASKAFLAGIKVANLKLYADPSAKMGAPLRVIGMPTTILINGEGREIGRLVGEAEWDSGDAKRLIRAYIK